MFSRRLLVIALLLSCGRYAMATPGRSEKKGAKIEAYIAMVNDLVAKEKKKGVAVPKYRNEAKLPLMVFPKAFEGTERVEFRIDVSGVQKLYIGTGERMTVRGVTLDGGDGVKTPLRSKDGKVLVKMAFADKRRFRWHRAGDFYVQQAETMLELDGKYKWISGRIDAQRAMVWMSDASNLPKLNAWRRMRGSRQSAMQKAGFNRRHDGPMLPA